VIRTSRPGIGFQFPIKEAIEGLVFRKVWFEELIQGSFQLIGLDETLNMLESSFFLIKQFALLHRLLVELVSDVGKSEELISSPGVEETHPCSHVERYRLPRLLFGLAIDDAEIAQLFVLRCCRVVLWR
jgi:hypothetical protein